MPVGTHADRTTVLDEQRSRPGLKSRQLFAIWLTQLLQGISITMPMNIAVFMVRFFEGAGADEKQVSRLTGLLAAGMTAAQFLTSFAWGRCSDVIGRKPVMLIGNLSGAISMLALGCSPTFAWALASRFVGGLFNGTSIVVKTVIGESCDATQQAQAMGTIGLGWGMGTVLGPLIGGLLSDPCRQTTINLYGCGQDELLQRKPFLLPCTLVGAFLAVTAVINACALQETLPRKRSTPSNYSAADYTTSCQSPIVMKKLSSEISLSKQSEFSLSSIRIKADDLSPPGGSATLPGLHSFESDSPHSEMGSESDSSSMQPLSRDDSSMAESESERLLIREPTSDVKSDSLSDAADDWGTAATTVWYRHTPVLLALLANCVAGLCFAFMDELTPIFASASIGNGGLELTPDQLAMPMAFGGVSLTVFALLIYPKLQPRIGILWTCRLGLLCFVPAALLTPCASLFVCDVQPNDLGDWRLVVSKGVLYVTQSLKGVSGIMALTGATIIVNVLAPPGQLGSVVGAAQTGLNLVRAAGPALSGVAWAISVSLASPGHQFLPFLTIAVAALGTSLLFTKRLPISIVEH